VCRMKGGREGGSGVVTVDEILVNLSSSVWSLSI
jgi:hypothetical protein